MRWGSGIRAACAAGVLALGGAVAAGIASGSGAPPRADGTGAAGQERPPVTIPRTEQRLLRSRANGVEYRLYVSLPRGHDTASAPFPVVYLLDADYSFAIAHNIVEHLSDRGNLAPAILVGIAYAGAPAYRRNRTRDYTPTAVPTGGYGPEYQRDSGGGPRFRQFVADELIPWVEREYGASEKRVLVGHSYGGLFAAWTLVTRPELFHGYVVVSPSLWYDDHRVFEMEAARAARGADLPARVYMAVGSREVNHAHDMVRDLSRFAATLEQREYPGLTFRWSVEPGETHNSIFPGALSDGLRYVLEGW